MCNPHLLDDYVDGRLPQGVRRSLKRHVRGCPDCRDAVEGLRALRLQASSLPRAIEPGRDLWPEVARRVRIGCERRRSAARPVPRVLLRPAWAFAFSVAVCVLLTLIAPWSQSPITVIRGLACEGAARSTGVLGTTNGDFDPTADARATLSRHIAMVDGAIGQLLAALREDPSDLRLVHLLQQEYQRKASLVRTTARLLRELDAGTSHPIS